MNNSTASTCPPLLPLEAFKGLYGTVFIASYIAITLWGMSALQTYIYFREKKFNADVLWLRASIGATLVLETLHSIFVIYMMYHYMFQTSLVDIEGSLAIHWTVPAFVITTMFIVLLTESAFIYRIWILSRRSKAVIAVPVLLLVWRCTFQIIGAYYLFARVYWASYAMGISSILFRIGLCANAVMDLLITILMAYYLRKAKVTFTQTQKLIEKLILYFLSTGLITTAVTIAIVITYSIPRSLVFAALYIVGGKLYSNSLLASLNSRAYEINDGVRMDGRLPNRTPLPTHKLTESHIMRSRMQHSASDAEPSFSDGNKDSSTTSAHDGFHGVHIHKITEISQQ